MFMAFCAGMMVCIGLFALYFVLEYFISNRCFFKSSLIDRYTLKIKDDSFPSGGNALKKKDDTESIGKGRENDRN